MRKLLLVLLLIFELLLLPISLFVHIPEYLTAILSVITVILLIISKRQLKGIVMAISIAVASWSVISAYILPYWNASLCYYKPVHTMDSQSKLSCKEALEDLNFALKYVRKLHPSCIHGMTQTIINKADDIYGEYSTKDSITINELHQNIQSLLSELNDAHTTIYTKYDSVHQLKTSISDTLSAINGISLSNLFENKRKLYCFESEEWGFSQMISDCYSLEGLKFLGFEIQDSIVFSYLKYNEVYNHTYGSDDFSVMNRTFSSPTSNGIAKYSVIDSMDIGYFYLRTCELYRYREWKRLDKGLQDFFYSVKDHGVHNVVFDLRDNPGGRYSIISHFFKYLPTEKYLIQHYNKRISTLLFSNHPEKNNSPDQELVFTGNIYVLTSLNTFSTATLFADILQGNGLAKIVGEQSGNAVNCCSGVFFFTLPNSKLLLSVSNNIYSRVNDDITSDFVIPDITCDANDAFNVVTMMTSNYGIE